MDSRFIIVDLSTSFIVKNPKDDSTSYVDVGKYKNLESSPLELSYRHFLNNANRICADLSIVWTIKHALTTHGKRLFKWMLCKSMN